VSIVVVATIEPVPEHRAEVIVALEDTIIAVHADDEGCELYALHEGLIGSFSWRNGRARMRSTNTLVEQPWKR
jgi:quinol monooxygenase YgiN